MTDPAPPEALTSEQRAAKVTALADGILVRLLKEIHNPETKAAPCVAAALDLLRAVAFNWHSFARVGTGSSAKTPDGLPIFEDEDSTLPAGVTVTGGLPKNIQAALDATNRTALTTPFPPKI